MLIVMRLAAVLGFINAALSGPIIASSLQTLHDVPLRRWDKTAAVEEKLWFDSVCRGGQFVAAFKGTDEQAGKIFGSKASPPTMRNQWRGDLRSNMEKWGWQEVDADDDTFCDYENFWKYGTSYDALVLNKKPKFSGFPKKPIKNGGDNVCYEVWHGEDDLENDQDQDQEVPFIEQEYKVNGQEYSKTGANHEVAINQVGGVVTAQFRISPLHAAKRNWGWDPHSTELPALRSSADLLWGSWYRDNPNIKNIRYFWAQAVSNAQTVSIIASALKMRGRELTGWPGTTFSTEDNELGNKMITKVRVFWSNENDKRAEKDRHPEMLFHVEDVPR